MSGSGRGLGKSADSGHLSIRSMSAPTPLRVRLPFRSEDEFAAQYGAHVGRDGFFLATRAPKPVGMQLLFDLVLADGSSLLRGEGVVVRSSATGDRPGMTVRFVRLESAGKALVDRIVSGRPARGSAPAEAQAHPSAWAPPVGPRVTSGPPAREMTPRPAHREAWAPPGAPAVPGRPAPVEVRSPPPAAEMGWAEAEAVESPTPEPASTEEPTSLAEPVSTEAERLSAAAEPLSIAAEPPSTAAGSLSVAALASTSAEPASTAGALPSSEDLAATSEQTPASSPIAVVSGLDVSGAAMEESAPAETAGIGSHAAAPPVVESNGPAGSPSWS